MIYVTVVTGLAHSYSRTRRLWNLLVVSWQSYFRFVSWGQNKDRWVFYSSPSSTFSVLCGFFLSFRAVSFFEIVMWNWKSDWTCDSSKYCQHKHEFVRNLRTDYSPEGRVWSKLILKLKDMCLYNRYINKMYVTFALKTDTIQACTQSQHPY